MKFRGNTPAHNGARATWLNMLQLSHDDPMYFFDLTTGYSEGFQNDIASAPGFIRGGQITYFSSKSRRNINPI
jgi:hypothetical protein